MTLLGASPGRSGPNDSAFISTAAAATTTSSPPTPIDSESIAKATDLLKGHMMPNNNINNIHYNGSHDIGTTDLYNLMQDIVINKLVIDLRPSDQWKQCHIRDSVNLPAPTKDILLANQQQQLHSLRSSADNARVPTDFDFNITKYIASYTGVKYWNLVFQQVVVISDGRFTKDINQANIDLHQSGDCHPFRIDSDNWDNHVLHYLIARRKKAQIAIYHAGFSAYQHKYPFLCQAGTDQPSKQSARERQVYPTEVLEDFLYLGSYENASSVSQLKQLINMAVELEDCFPHMFKYYRADLKDNFTADLTSHFPAIYQFIHEARVRNERVLVHCAMGVSRSTAAVISYLMKEYRYSYDHSRAFIKEKRSIIQPNFSFVKALKAYEQQLGIGSGNGPTATISLRSSGNNITPAGPIILNSDGLIMTSKLPIASL
ncbi:hypothetical protein SAMD00019534_071700 [Acytostelium subglobosum LB1]|uniref:hypothetical protein n=1 Tax=Acytostelium subglobosum LB1 TaxID=1410327 RepID=UPI0006449581|nr:hypothetical protein SAMD00019534_071700 [Acytostelium subglobosum LB1]GAM23995.1 hypothetical protein SAMD00019534_071700 [Acytostelium subglobosum LB1]|eukprot:XP_012753031.1 hypothetical protein SAMD00019534_071700 [Acytostelium subglobosum LB1]